MSSPLAVVGAGGFAREVAELIRDLIQDGEQWELLGFLTDDSATWGSTINDLPVLGGVDWLAQHADVQAAMGIGSPVVKWKMVERLAKAQVRFPSLVHPRTVRSRYLEIGVGAVITAGNTLTANIVLGDFSMINLHCTVGHDTTIGDFATISPGVSVSGNVRIGRGCDIGTGSALIQGVTVG